jgi:Putative beta barrel porin-7 (BBP7)
MRKKLLGTIAALAAGAGGALAQSPAKTTAPAAVGTVGAFDGGMTDPMVRLANAPGNPVVPPPMGGGEGMPPDIGVDPMMGGGPMYPPPGVFGSPGWEEPQMNDGLFGGGPAKFYVDGQYLLLFPEKQPVGFPLLTSGSPAAGEQGRIGGSTTIALAGNRGTLSLGSTSGFRINTGIWRPQDMRLGVEVGGLYMAPVSNTVFMRSSDQGIPLLARPFISTATGVQSVLIASSPGVVNGDVFSRATTNFWGIEASGLFNLYRTCPDNCRSWTLNLVGGYRFAEFQETLSLSTRATALPGRTLPYAGTTVSSPTTVEVRDRFDALNKFHGGQVGLQSQFSSGRWYVGATGKVGFGATNQRVIVDGISSAVNPNTQESSQTLGGLFANASNIGRYKADQFAILTDVNGTVGYNFTRWLTGTVGYNFIHLSSVARPGNLFNGRVDPALVPTSGTYGTGANGSPLFTVKQDDFFVHGLNFGFIVRY